MRKLLLLLTLIVLMTPASVSAQTRVSIPDSYTSGSIAASGAANAIVIPTNGRSTVGLDVSGTWSGSLLVAASVDYATVGAANAHWGVTTAVIVTTGAIANAVTANGQYQINAGGFSAIRVYAASLVSGTANLNLLAANGVSTFMADNPIPVTPSAPTTPWITGSNAYLSTASITRPANTTTYTVNTGWCGATSACATVFTWTSVCSGASKMVLIPQISIYSSANPTLKLQGLLWLFKTTPGTVINDNGNFNIASADYANLTGGSKGGIPFTLTSNQGSGAANSGVSLTGLNAMAVCNSGAATIYGMVEVANAYVPVSGEVLTIDISSIGIN